MEHLSVGTQHCSALENCTGHLQFISMYLSLSPDMARSCVAIFDFPFDLPSNYPCPRSSARSSLSPRMMRTIEASLPTTPLATYLICLSVCLILNMAFFKCNTANIALLQMRRSLSNRLEAGLNTRLTKTLRGESLIPWWICAVRSTTVTWKNTFDLFPHSLYRVQQSQYI